jgi:hypothetical protein
MATDTRKMTLWADAGRGRFFLVPDDHPLAPGSFVLRTITGHKQRADPTAVAPFEVKEEQAKEWVKGEFGQILDNARGAVNRFLERLRNGPEKPDRIADLRELLDRVEAIVDLIAAASPDGEVAAEDIEALADRLDGIEAHLRQLAERLHTAPPLARPTDPSTRL